MSGKIIEPDTMPMVQASKTETPIQLTWHNITIRALPPTGRCKPRNAIKEPKTIIDNVSGTVMPG
jgi:hypothetical protein